ncbi:MAG: alpha-hydroxy-acid oxidizing protein [Betaproteobacteria bacterium]|nr:alpha-hydroxy-acid oxidizing protein [Betaproteobacteria bacterium]
MFEMLEGGADDEATLRRNRSMFARFLLSPKALVAIDQRDLGIDLLGVPGCRPSSPDRGQRDVLDEGRPRDGGGCRGRGDSLRTEHGLDDADRGRRQGQGTAALVPALRIRWTAPPSDRAGAGPSAGARGHDRRRDHG